MNGLQSTQTLASLDARAVAQRNTQSLERALDAVNAGNPEEAASAFGSLFSTMLVKELRRSLPEGFFSGAGAETYSAWLDEHIGGVLAERDALGLGQMIRVSLERKDTQEAASAA